MHSTAPHFNLPFLLLDGELLPGRRVGLLGEGDLQHTLDKLHLGLVAVAVGRQGQRALHLAEGPLHAVNGVGFQGFDLGTFSLDNELIAVDGDVEIW